jgi:hypothetical protein
MKFDPKKPVVGVIEGKERPARVVSTDMKGKSPVLALIDYGSYEVAFKFKADGSYSDSRIFYLKNVVEKTSKFFAIWERSPGTQPKATYDDAVIWGRTYATALSPLIGVVEYRLEDNDIVDVVYHPYEKEVK